MIVKTRARKKKKRRGVFYTPDRLSTALADWAIRLPSDLVLEPGFGGCGLLEAAAARLNDLGAEAVEKNIFGCDVDQMAFKHLRETFGEAPPGNFLKEDFLVLTSDSFTASGFDVILSNPPYVSHHNMFGTQRRTAFALSTASKFPGGKRASLWAYFVWHGMQFLRSGGRAAWVLPGSLLNTDYSNALLGVMRTKFRRLCVASITERLFLADGTDESTEVLLAEGYGLPPETSEVTIEWCESVDHFTQLMADWNGKKCWQQALPRRSKSMLMGKICTQLVESIEKEPCCQRLGDFARISIGIVTGANRYFVLDKDSIAGAGLSPEHFDYVLSKFGMARGVRLTQKDLDAASNEGARCFLLHTADRESEAQIEQYLATFPKELLDSNRTFQKRVVWHQPDDGQIPDGFFPYMNHVGPRIVMNDARVTSTNTVHRVFFKPLLGPDFRKMIAISLMSTFSHLSAEIEGRTYGSGVLKFEPTEARKIKLLIPKHTHSTAISRVYIALDDAMRTGNSSEAKTLADDFLQGEMPELYTPARLAVFSAALGELRNRRHAKKVNEHKDSVEQLEHRDTKSTPRTQRMVKVEQLR